METTKNCIWDTLYTKSCKFEVAKDLLDLAQTGDAEATFQIGMQALQEERLGYATIFLQLAAKNGHPEAAQLLAEIITGNNLDNINNNKEFPNE